VYKRKSIQNAYNQLLTSKRNNLDIDEWQDIYLNG